MSYTNQTTHYGLPLPTQTDLVNGLDNNDAFERIDSAIYSAEQAATTATSDITSIKQSVAQLENADVTLQSDITGVKARVSTLEENETSVVEDIQDTQDMITAREVPTAQSDQRILVGEWFRYNGVLYVCTAQIDVDNTIVPNVNCRATNIESEIESLSPSGEVIDTTARNGVSTNATHIGNLANLETDDKTSLVAAINEVLLQIGGGTMPILDYAHPLFSFTSTSLTYTATEECYLYGNFGSTGGAFANSIVTIDGTQAYNVSYNNSDCIMAVPITKIGVGTTVTLNATAASNNCCLKVYKEVE